MLLLNISSIEEHEKTGKVRILAAANDKRSPLRPNLATVSEAGVPGFATTAWFGLFAPANTPPEVVAKIYADVSKALDHQQTKDFFAKNSFERVALTPQEFPKLIESDTKHWEALVKSVGAKLE